MDETGRKATWKEMVPAVGTVTHTPDQLTHVKCRKALKVFDIAMAPQIIYCVAKTYDFLRPRQLRHWGGPQHGVQWSTPYIYVAGRIAHFDI